MSATESTSTSTGTCTGTSTSTSAPRPKPYAVPGVSMRDLLAAGAAARAVSTPPRAPDERRKAA